MSQTQESAQNVNKIINIILSHVEDVIKVIKTSVDQAVGLMEGVTVPYSNLVDYLNEVCRLSVSQENTTADTDSSVENS